ncbi:MAG: energy transducer TonB [Alphaproteobacteria bacterium]|nr:energy transducer TonB [Alphaproteobacteria bacterium]
MGRSDAPPPVSATASAEPPASESPAPESPAAASPSEEAAPIAGEGVDWSGFLAAVSDRVGAALRYPPAARARRQTGRVVLLLRLDRAGGLVGCALSETSGVSALDRAACRAARRAAPYPPPPGGAAGPGAAHPGAAGDDPPAIRIPVLFSLR